MKKINLIGISMLVILFISSFLLIKKNQAKDTSVFSESNQSVTVFSATLTDEPRQIEQTDNYYLSFDNVHADNDESQRELAILHEGGALITTLPADKEIKAGDQINVIVHKDFATTYSTPPQLIGNSVISVSF